VPKSSRRRGGRSDGPRRIRASDAERDDIAQILATAFTDGRLDLDEYDTRVAAVYAATYREELPPLIDDLPAPDPPFFARRASATISTPTPVPEPEPAPVPAGTSAGRRGCWLVALALLGGALVVGRLGHLPVAALLGLFGLLIVSVPVYVSPCAATERRIRRRGR
jgi:hypothetical protein